MTPRHRPHVVALTGGIASGKTAVSREFEALGVPVIDTDLIAREVVAPGQPLLGEIAETFGAHFVGADGTLQRRLLREHVFSDPAARERLEALMHPAIREVAWSRIDALDAPYCILVVPLLVESGAFPDVDRVLVVDVPETLQVERLLARDGVSRAGADAALAAQASREQRLAAADDVIVNDGELADLGPAVRRLHADYLARFGSGDGTRGGALGAWLTWIALSAVGLALALSHLDSVFWAESIHPLGPDSHYHAARMLDIAAEPSSVHGFDDRIHWPDGAWISLPWAYDYLAGAAASVLAQSREDRLRLLLAYPLVWLVLNTGLGVLIAWRLFAPPLAVLAAAAFVLNPLSLELHRYGNVDHHAAELFWLLTSLYLLGRWLQRPGARVPAIMLGAALGLATAFHNGLFLLQAPVLLALLVQRWRARQTSGQAARTGFAAALVLSQFAVLLPSHALWSGAYAFYHLSWFHLHVALLTALFVYGLGIQSARRAVTGLVALGVLALPLLPQLARGLGFVAGDLPSLALIREAQSPFTGDLTLLEVSSFYTLFVWLVPLSLVYASVRLWSHTAGAAERALCAFGLLGLPLLALQVRFFYFGYLPMLFIPLLAAQHWLGRSRAMLYGVLAVTVAYGLSVPLYTAPPPPGGSLRYYNGFPLVQALESACAREPGLLLAPRTWGHYLRLGTDCPIIASNLIMTDEDFRANAHAERLLALPPGELRSAQPEVRYVLASALEPNALGEQLLEGSAPRGFEAIGEARNFKEELVGRVYRVAPGAAPD